MEKSISVSKKVLGEDFNLNIYKLESSDLEEMLTQGYSIQLNLTDKPYVIEASCNGRVERIIIDEEDIVPTIEKLISKGEDLEDYEKCHELLLIKRAIG